MKKTIQLCTFWSVQKHRKTGRKEVMISFYYSKLKRPVSQILKYKTRVNLGKLYTIATLENENDIWFLEDDLINFKAIWHPRQLFKLDIFEPVFEYPKLEVTNEVISLSILQNGSDNDWLSLTVPWKELDDKINKIQLYKTSYTPIKHIDYRGQVQLLTVLKNYREYVFERMDNQHQREQDQHPEVLVRPQSYGADNGEAARSESPRSSGRDWSNH